MLSITQLFGLTKETKEYPYMPRQINLSGNVINFSMPENFSKDLPAEDLIEILNINDVSIFSEKKPVTLLRRWWDFYDDSFFKKSVGTMMMTIHIYIIDDSSRDISHPIGFVETLLLEMQKRDNEENLGRDESNKVYFPEFYQSFQEKTYNNQKWLSGGGADANYTQVAFHEWKQITQNHFLGVEFHFAPNNDISMRNFIDIYCRDMLEKIMSSFDVIYANENTIKAKLEANSQLNLEQLVNEVN